MTPETPEERAQLIIDCLYALPEVEPFAPVIEQSLIRLIVGAISAAVAAEHANPIEWRVVDVGGAEWGQCLLAGWEPQLFNGDKVILNRWKKA